MAYKPAYLLLLSFFEGAAVMICELIGAKLLAPYFGTSLYVWAAALALTLGGLALGYFTGGQISRYTQKAKKGKGEQLLLLILFCAAALLGTMPYTSHWILEASIQLPLQWGAVLALGTFMLPPLFCLGMVSPLIIGLLTQQAKMAGNHAGKVYAISTFGGILATFVLGFYIIPEFGLKIPAIFSGVVLAVLPVLSLITGFGKLKVNE
ncbi:MAG: hypothetical protein GYB31_04025 [Bacteroidetes bacterium]|nr:hypothetical protein [Bacteroidota bacterium]